MCTEFLVEQMRAWKRLAVVITLLIAASAGLAQAPSHPVYVVLWFDTEDYILPASDDAAKRLAEFLTAEGVPATFKIVGEKARTLERRGRSDVIAALDHHDIGYHANTHSQHPLPPNMNPGWIGKPAQRNLPVGNRAASLMLRGYSAKHPAATASLEVHGRHSHTAHFGNGG